MLMERYTPTPEPYTEISSHEDVGFGLGSEFGMEVAVDSGVPISLGSQICYFFTNCFHP
jgi:hypothetical protein